MSIFPPRSPGPAYVPPRYMWSDEIVPWWDRLSRPAQKAFLRSEYVEPGFTPETFREWLVASLPEVWITEDVREWVEQVETRIVLDRHARALRDASGAEVEPAERAAPRDTGTPPGDALLSEVRGLRAKRKGLSPTQACNIVGSRYNRDGQTIALAIKRATGKRSIKDAVMVDPATL